MIRLGRAQAEPADASPPNSHFGEPQLGKFFWCVAIGLGLLQVWAHRNDVSPDGISYIEIAEAASRNGWHALVNGYWSPLYPLLLGIVFRIVHPTMYWEFTWVHGVNFVVYLANLFCFEIFLRELVAARRKENEPAMGLRALPEKVLCVWGYLLFLWASQVWLTPAMTVPDLLVAGLTYLATAVLLRIYVGKGSALLFVGLGALLGAAYLAKTAMFLLAFVFLGSGFLLHLKRKASFWKAVRLTAAATAVFLLIAAPLVLGISEEKHRITFGDSGKIAYAEYVNRATWLTHWQGEPAGTGVPVHPTRKIFFDPAMYEFATPVPGSYPPWYDPSYWYEGIKPHFSVRGQLWVLYRAANLYLKMFSRTGALYVVFVALIVWVRKAGKWEWGGKEFWLVWLPSLAASAMYALVLVEERYVSGFVLMLLMWVLSSARISETRGETPRKRVLAATMIAPALAVAWYAARDLKNIAVNKPYEPWEVAVALHKMGISSGAQVGYIGTGLDAYWAHLAGVRIVAEVPEKAEKEFVAADAIKKSEVMRKFAEVGAEAVVTKDEEIANSMAGWQKISQTEYYVWIGPRS